MNYLKNIKLPIFLPDATSGVVRGIDSVDIKSSQIEGIVVNTFHIHEKLGSKILKHQGGIKQFMNWDGFVISDSGGFQVFSIIYNQGKAGTITDKGIQIKSSGNNKKVLFSPEKSIQTQFRIGSDLMVCLDDFVPDESPIDDIKRSVDRTIAWGKRCKEEFNKMCKQYKFNEDSRPLLCAVIQGGHYEVERKRCAEGLIEIGFDVYGFGGWPLNKDNSLNKDIMRFTANLLPDDKPKYALGLGSPQNIVECYKMGWRIFDCVLPTRDARHQKLYVLNYDPKSINLLEVENCSSNVYVREQKYKFENGPISEFCDCHTCINYSISYLNYLFQIEDKLAERLATIHNLRTYSLLIENLRKFGND